ncbi:hypothetical protein D3C76_1298710 [compost metagenome]
MVLAAEAFHQRDPEFAVMLELGEFVGVEDVAQVAGDHRWVLAQVVVQGNGRTEISPTPSSHRFYGEIDQQLMGGERQWVH